MAPHDETPGMHRNNNGRLASALGQHLIVMLVIAAVVITSLAALPSVLAETAATASQLDERAHVHHGALVELEAAP